MTPGGEASTVTWPVVGRDAEVRALAEGLDDASCGGIALVGAAGFGKTRLALRATELAAEKGFSSISVRATRSSAAIPFGALAPLFAELGVDQAVTGSPLASSTTALGAVLAALESRAREGRMVVVDDAHQLDDASIALLDQLVVHRRIFIVFTLRTGEGRGDAVVEMWKDQRILRVEIGPLPRRDLRVLALMALPGPPDSGALKAIVEACGGNVLYLRELVQGAVESGLLVKELGLWRLRGPLGSSPRLHDLIEERLGTLTDAEREALELVALGDPLELALLEHLVPLPVIEALEARGLIEAWPADHGPAVRLHHPLYGEVVRAQLPALRKVRLSRSLADAAEPDSSTRRTDMLRAALWRLDGGGGGGRVETTLTAARSALALEDYALAFRLAQSAWSEHGSPEAALLAGDALDFLGRPAEAEKILAIATDRHDLTDRQRTSLVVRRAACLFRSLNRPQEADRVVDEAARAITDPGCRRELKALRGNHLLLAGEVRAAIDLDQEILAQPGDAAFAQASLDVGTGLALAGRTTEALEHTRQALELRRDLDDEEQLSRVGVYLVAQSLASLYHGDLETARSIGEAGHRVSVEKGNADGQAWFAAILGYVLMNLGRPVSAVHLFREVATLFKAMHHPGERWGLGGLALAGAHLGDRELALTAVAELDAMPLPAVRLQDVAIVRGRAWTSLACGELSKARQELWSAVELAEDWGQLAAASEALHDLVRAGAGAPAAERLIALAERIDGSLIEARATFARAVLERDLDAAARAADLFEAMGARLHAAEGAVVERQLAGAQGLHRRASSADRRARRILEGCEGATLAWLEDPVTPSSAVRLSEREREVALLAAQQLTSKEIAEKLFVSSRTVDNHLHRIYTKLGIAKRSELAEVMQDQGP